MENGREETSFWDLSSKCAMRSPNFSRRLFPHLYNRDEKGYIIEFVALHRSTTYSKHLPHSNDGVIILGNHIRYRKYPTHSRNWINDCSSSYVSVTAVCWCWVSNVSVRPGMSTAFSKCQITPTKKKTRGNGQVRINCFVCILLYTNYLIHASILFNFFPVFSRCRIRLLIHLMRQRSIAVYLSN